MLSSSIIRYPVFADYFVVEKTALLILTLFKPDISKRRAPLLFWTQRIQIREHDLPLHINSSKLYDLSTTITGFFEDFG